MIDAARVLYSALGTLLPVAVVALSCVGCEGGPTSRVLQDGFVSGVGPSFASDGQTQTNRVACADASEGCPCPRDGDTLRCSGPKIHTGNYTSCEPGTRECANGTWGPCIGKTVYENVDMLTQEYVSPCPTGQTVRWGAVTVQGLTPGDSHIDLRLQTAETHAGLDTAPPVHAARFDGALNANWTSAEVDALLATSALSPASWLRVTLVLVRSSQKMDAPMVVDWRQAMTCGPA